MGSPHVRLFTQCCRHSWAVAHTNVGGSRASGYVIRVLFIKIGVGLLTTEVGIVIPLTIEWVNMK